jgi:phage tail sheath gpL-like
MPETTAFDRNRVARGVGIRGEHRNMGVAGSRYRPARIAILAQGNADTSYSTTKRRIYSANEVGEVEGWGSPAHLIARALFPRYRKGVGDLPVTLYPLAQPVTGGVQAAGSITPSIPVAITKTQQHYVLVNNIRSETFTTVVGDSVATVIDSLVSAISAVLEMPITATDGETVCNVEVGWEGTSGNNVYIEVVSPIDTEVEFAIVQPTNGAGTPDITDALSQVGNIWESYIINALDYTDSTELDEYAAFGEGRRDSEVHKPCCVIVGCNEATLNTVTAVTDARKTDRTNVILTNPGSHDLPFIIAAEGVKNIAMRDNSNPAYDYCMMACDGLTSGADGVQWTSAQRDAAVKAGCSTIEVRDGVVYISDTVTCYHPTGEEPPGYRYVVDYAKRCTIINELDLSFNTDDWAGNPLVGDDQPTRNIAARKPKHAKAVLYGIIDRLALDAVIADPDFAKENSDASIGLTNDKRLDVKLVARLAGNTNVISIDFTTGFYYGS